ncbi:2-oxoacid:ferredoxin oxidoreductase subunit beta [Alicyclobacillus ferrooxydans]|uniref:2-oxoacid ferredoxin oxidoreductase n=1 Tax=Alicyclobacillus ferrooxydans TaxID=471514 RepID=A0A0P9CQF4_9BACL|nr:2-oxoacid:ferredoxin oxidoreductase subunit beta [Alicyclobacillus ferrooxydans]KPV45138.1 2-oxoacid ferredoxin oxidoreductase [Alicyclobacillus ferrooxydans]
MATVKDFRNDIRPNWCPGCGDFSVQASIQRALASLGKEPHEVALISGIGCSGRISGYVNTYGFHGVHGRALPTAQGVKLANRDLTVLASGGDGDGFGIGLNHFMHAVRRNMDITYIVMDNRIYGLTKGQTSPTSAHGFTAKTTPSGNIEEGLVPTQVALSAGIGFLAQGFSSDVNQLVGLIEQAIQYKGFSLVNVYSPCVTYNKINTYDYFRDNIFNLDKVEGYDPTDFLAAQRAITEHDGLVTGLIYRNDNKVAYEDQIPGYQETPISQADLQVSDDIFTAALREYA